MNGNDTTLWKKLYYRMGMTSLEKGVYFDVCGFFQFWMEFCIFCLFFFFALWNLVRFLYFFHFFGWSTRFILDAFQTKSWIVNHCMQQAPARIEKFNVVFSNFFPSLSWRILHETKKAVFLLNDKSPRHLISLILIEFLSHVHLFIFKHWQKSGLAHQHYQIDFLWFSSLSKRMNNLKFN